MFVLIRRSALPQLRWVPGGVACLQGERLRLYSVAPATPEHPVLVSVEPSGDGYGVALSSCGRAEEVARFPSRRLARRQLRRLAGETGASGWGWLGRGAAAAGLLLLVWFLFVVPNELPVPAVAAQPAPNNPSTGPKPPFGQGATPAPPDDTPAFVDDPAASASIP